MLSTKFTTLLFLVFTLFSIAEPQGADAEHGTLADAHRAAPIIPEDLTETIQMLENSYKDHPGYKHYLWDYMRKGEYDLDFLRKYALYYYEHVRVFRLYLAGAMTVVHVEPFQVVLSEVIADEFGVQLFGEPDVDGHPELFRRFMRSLDLTENDWERVSTGKNVLPGVAHYKNVHYSLFRGDLAEEIVGAIVFGMERTTPHRHSSVVEGIKKFQARTGLGLDIDYQFYSEHVSVDDYHNNALISSLIDWFYDPVKVQRMLKGCLTSFDARKEFLDNLADKLGVPKPEDPSQVETLSFNSAVELKDPSLVVGFQWKSIHELMPHEKTSEFQHKDLVNYLQNTEEDTMLPAITISRSGVILDGHHRFNALADLGFSSIPCLIVDYDHEDIVLRSQENEISKSEVLSMARAGKAFDRKSTKHKVKDKYGQEHPILVLSPIVHIPHLSKHRSQESKHEKQEI